MHLLGLHAHQRGERLLRGDGTRRLGARLRRGTGGFLVRRIELIGVRLRGGEHPADRAGGRGAELAGHDLRLDRVHQLLEHVERLALVFDERIALAVGAQVHAMAEIVHRAQVVLPLAVDRIEKHAALHERQHLLIFRRALGLVGILDTLHHELARLLRLPHERLQLLIGHRDGERDAEPVGERAQIAILRIEEVLLGLRHHQIVHHVEDRVVDLRRFAAQDGAAQLIDDRTLLVHHVVELERALADREMLLLHAALRGLHGLVQPAVLHHLALLEAETEHDARKLL